jgi:Fe-S oxidoreductase
VLEPSCCSVFRDELTNLFPELPRAERLKKQTFTLSEFLEKQDGFIAPTLKRKAVIHGHCHHKAVMRMKAEESMFKKIGLDYEMLDSGCCGMAGSFGFESDKYDLSVNVGERVLLPAVRKAEPSTILIAEGFSCREQIAQLTRRQALHTAEVLALAMSNSTLEDHNPPESGIVRRRERAHKRSMMKAGAVSALGIAALAFFFSRRK